MELELRQDHLKALNGFLAKSGGKDKLTALIQYTCMFISAGQPGVAKDIQVSVTRARKIFRIGGPVEALTPLVLNPALNPSKPVAIEVINKLKGVLMALYFAADHVVWAGQAGIYTHKANLERAQKASLYGWMGGSFCGAASEIYELARLTSQQRGKASAEEWRQRQARALEEINTRLLTLFHAGVQAALAAGLLNLFAWKPRFVGFLGVVASALNCYFLFPAVPKPLLKSKPAPAPAPPAAASAAAGAGGTCPAPSAGGLARRENAVPAAALPERELVAAAKAA